MEAGVANNLIAVILISGACYCYFHISPYHMTRKSELRHRRRTKMHSRSVVICVHKFFHIIGTTIIFMKCTPGGFARKIMKMMETVCRPPHPQLSGCIFMVDMN